MRTEGNFTDVRNLAILELFYSTGMRLSELQGLSRGDLDLVSQQVKVRGKGRKERIVPIGDHASLALRNYEAKRDDLLRNVKPGAERTAYFLSRTGKRIGVRMVQKVVSGFLDGDRRGRRSLGPLAAPHLRYAPARRGRGPAGCAGATGPRFHLDDADLHTHERRTAQAGVSEIAPSGMKIA